jgi:hypothetical protein
MKSLLRPKFAQKGPRFPPQGEDDARVIKGEFGHF